jgi:hypothetical protein
MSRVRATHPSAVILFNFVTLTIYCEEYKLWNSSLRSFLYPLVTSSLLGTNSLLNMVFLNTHNVGSPFKERDHF